MRLGKVIGRVTLSTVIPELTGARWLVVSPLSRTQYGPDALESRKPGPEPSLVVYDNLGGGVGDTIGFVEGREAAQPLDPVAAIDAFNAAIVDTLFYQPRT
jgi:carbon dioxide concentrating mechanism protein CcmL